MSGYFDGCKTSTLQFAYAFVAMIVLLVTPAAYAEGPVTSSLEAFIVEVGEDGKESLMPADKVLPGGVIEYHITYSNNTSDGLANFVVNGDIPEQTRYIANSQEVNLAANFQAYIEDLGWVDIPAFRTITNNDGQPEKVEINPSEYTALHWTLAGDLSPETSVSVVYRVKVDS